MKLNSTYVIITLTNKSKTILKYLLFYIIKSTKTMNLLLFGRMYLNNKKFDFTVIKNENQ